MTTHLTVGPRASVVWCRASLTYSDSTTVFASKATCRACLSEYIVKAWAPGSQQAVCRPAHDHCDQPVAREGDQCPGHANAAAQYAAE